MNGKIFIVQLNETTIFFQTNTYFRSFIFFQPFATMLNTIQRSELGMGIRILLIEVFLFRQHTLEFSTHFKCLKLYSNKQRKSGSFIESSSRHDKIIIVAWFPTSLFLVISKFTVTDQVSWLGEIGQNVRELCIQS